jgi:hypothetical protein
MRFTFTLLLCVIIGDLFGQNEKEVAFIKHKLHLKENKIYIFCRGTKAKLSLIAHKFNLRDTNITHVGIGFIENKKISIYNVTDNSNLLKSALILDSIESYVSSSEVFFLSIWEFKNTLKEFNNLKFSLGQYQNKKIVFDSFFNINHDDTLYCSEFCASLLNSICTNKYLFKPTSISLSNPLYQSYLERKVLIYFPVDFFEANKKFRQVFKHTFAL